MALYIDFLQPQFTKLLTQLPIQVFLLLANSRGILEKIEFNEFCQELKDPAWAHGKYTQQIFSNTQEDLPRLKELFGSKKQKVDLVIIQRGFKLLKQILEEGEMALLLDDFQSLTKKCKKIIETHGNYTAGDGERNRMAKRIFGAFKILESKESLSLQLTEIPFQLFLLIANADGQIDKNERACFLKILRSRDWCKSRCAQDFFVRTVYSYETLYKQYTAGLLKQDLSRVRQTLNRAVFFFHADEVTKMKQDLMRLSREIAASSGGFAGIKSTSKQEKTALEKVRMILRELKPSATKKTSTTKKVSPPQKKQDPKGESERNFAKLREENRSAVPSLSVTVSGLAEEDQVKVINIAKNGILCSIIFAKEYSDLFAPSTLSLQFPPKYQDAKIEPILCRTLRIQVLQWSDEHLPLAIQIAWKIIKIPNQHQKTWEKIINKIS